MQVVLVVLVVVAVVRAFKIGSGQGRRLRSCRLLRGNCDGESVSSGCGGKRSGNNREGAINAVGKRLGHAGIGSWVRWFAAKRRNERCGMTGVGDRRRWRECGGRKRGSNKSAGGGVVCCQGGKEWGNMFGGGSVKGRSR